jgi:hypothetical protein
MKKKVIENLHATFNTCTMVAEGATKNSIKLVHPLLWWWLCS